MSQDREVDRTNNKVDDAHDKERRQFLVGLGKWSKVIIAGAVLGGMVTVDREAHAWVNRRGGGGWINRRGGYRGGGRWINGRGGGGGSWVNRRGGGGSWVNRR